VTGMKDLMREYERKRFPAERRLDLQGEGPRSARDRALHWIQSKAHENPGEDLLLVVDRVGFPGRAPSPVHVEVQKLLRDLEGRLIEWWQPFAPGSIALRTSLTPTMHLPAPRSPAERVEGEGRTEETAGAARVHPREDIPPDLLYQAERTAERRIEREGHSIRLLDVVLREVWIEVQALAMEERLTFDEAMRRVEVRERERLK